MDQNIPHFKEFLNTVKKRFKYSVAGHFQHANTNHIITMSFIRIEFKDDSFNIILREFNVCQVLISKKTIEVEKKEIDQDRILMHFRVNATPRR